MKKLTKKKSKDSNDLFPVQAPRGTQDVLPSEQKYWEYVVETAKMLFRGWDFQRLDTPLFEETTLFTRGVGSDTDIVETELFEIKSRGGGARYSLRPEGTAPLVRAFIQHGLHSWPKPVKLFYVGPFFRYDRPQAGRWRQLHQVGFEVFGSSSAVTDVEVIYVVHCFFQSLGLDNYVIRVNSLGEAADRRAYLKVLKEHYRRNRSKLCRQCKERLSTNPLRVLDCKEEKCQHVAASAPHLLDYLSEGSREQFEMVVSSLADLNVPHEVSHTLVRGLDYYTHTVWEVFPRGEDVSSQSSLAAGGRYNDLVKQLGGKQIAAVGGACGIERIIGRLKDEGVELTVTDRPQVFVAQLGGQAKLRAFEVMRMLQEAHIHFAESVSRDGMQPQLKLADKLGVSWAIIIGHKEVLDKTVILRNMENGMQEVVDHDDLVAELQKRLRIGTAS